MLSEKEKILIKKRFFWDLNFFNISKPRPASAPIVNCVYALEMSNGTVKFGITKSIKERIFAIKASGGLDVINFYHTEFAPHNFMLSVERACQKRFKDFQTQGEFFNITFDEACAELDKHKDEIASALKEADEKYLEELEYFWELEKNCFESKEKAESALIVATPAEVEVVTEDSKPVEVTVNAVQNSDETKTPVAAALKDMELSIEIAKRIFKTSGTIIASSCKDAVEEKHNVNLSAFDKLIFTAE